MAATLEIPEQDAIAETVASSPRRFKGGSYIETQEVIRSNLK